ncbi:MAG: chorismate synthase [Bacteroidales bacterium]|nr:chorismate synthase [Bacteroidales bacterium]
MSNNFGKIFKLTTFGESHGIAIGGVIDGFPPNIDIDIDFIHSELNKRKPGNSKITSNRKETDNILFLSGIYNNKSLGSPIAFITYNDDAQSADYEQLKYVFRPGHADFTYQKKYNIRDYRGGGRASARETFSRVVAGAFAKILLKKLNITVNAYVSKIGSIIPNINYSELNLSKTYDFDSRFPDEKINNLFTNEILKHKLNGDSVGGNITCVIKNAPIGLGEPVFNKLSASLSNAILSINACKGFEIGQGFNASNLLGSQNNDQLSFENNKINFLSNNSGGVLGGISTGQHIYFNAAFKPTPTIAKSQKTVDLKNNNITLQAKGRHDPSVVPRAVIVVEAMAAIVLADFILLKNSYNF